MTNRELSDGDAVAECDDLNALDKALDDYVIMSTDSYRKYAASESRAREAEAALKTATAINADLFRWALQLVENDGSGAVYHAGKSIEAHDQLRAILYYKTHPGAALLAELEAAWELSQVADDHCPHAVRECTLKDALAKYRAARGAR